MLFVSHGTLAQANGDVPWDDPATAAHMQRTIDEALIAKRIPGAAVSIRQGDMRWTSNAGIANVATGAAPTPDTTFAYRSVTKSFVTTVVIELADEGLIGLDDPVGRYVSGVPGGDEITIRQLAEMRSGLFSYTKSAAFVEELLADPGRAWTQKELLAFAFDEPLQFTPGTSYEYSNSNTVLLGEVIEAATGNAWSEEVRRRISRKLGLSSVVDQGAGAMPTPNAVGYVDVGDGTGPEPLDEFNASGAGASGALVGVVGDLERWGKALGTGELISRREFVARLKSFGSTAPDPSSPEYDSYGFGMGEISGYIGHTGSGLGFESLVMYDRANDRTITILVNAGNPGDSDAPADIFHELLEVLGWTEPAGQAQVAADGRNETVRSGTVWTGLVSGPFLTRAAVYADHGGTATADGPVTLAPMQDYVPAVSVGDGRVALDRGGEITASLGGDGAFLETATGTASLSLTDVTVLMAGDAISGIGVDARDNAVADLTGVTITGTALAGLRAGGDAPATIRGRGVAIDLSRGDGVRVEANGSVDLANGAVALSGEGVGLAVSGIDGAARMRGTGLDVETAAPGSFGVLALGAGADVALSGGSSVTTRGAEAHAVVLGNGATVELGDTAVSASGASAAAVAGIAMDGLPGSRRAALSLTDGTLFAASGTAVVAAGTDLTLTASGSQVLGAMTRSADARLDVTLADGSTWILPAAGTGATSRVDDLVNEGSTIAFAAPAGAGFQTLTAGRYSAVRGALAMNAALGGGGAADRLVVDGGLARGRTRLLVTALGDGALTHGDGIRLVEAVDGGRTTRRAFMLADRVASGALEYGLHRGGASGGEDWFLRSTHGGATGQGALPELRPEVAVDTAIPAIATQYGLALLGTRDARLAARGGSRGSAGWARVFGETGSEGSGGSAAARLKRFRDDGPSTDVGLGGFQAGYDYRLSQPGEAGETAIGFYLGAGHARGSVDAVYGGSAGKVSMDAYSLGATFSHARASGLNVDAVVQGTFYDEASARSVAGETLRTDGFGLIGSLEAGYRFDLGDGWAVEPRMQLVYQRLSMDDGADGYGRIDYAAADDVFGRIGARVSRDWSLERGQALTGWARASLMNGFGDGSEVTFTGLGGGNAMAFDSGLQGIRVELGAGASIAMSDRWSLFASGDFSARTNDTSGHTFAGQIGAVLRW